MKQLLTLLTAIIAFSISCFAQNNIQLKIHHKLGSQAFALNVGVENNLNHYFKLDRMEYYISGISIVHDGGLVTTVNDLYVLVNAAAATTIDLGDHDITTVESLRFYVGVDTEHNHLDPAIYESHHSLALQNPSMHWGWAGGYRFIAMEGSSGPNLDQVFNLHGLGDANYFQNQIPISATANNNTITLHIDADYTAVLKDIAINSGLIEHGEEGEAKMALENTRDFVFSASPVGTAIDEYHTINDFDVYPNPAADGMVTVSVSSMENASYQVLVSDMTGRQLQQPYSLDANRTIELNIAVAGFYIVSLVKDGQVILNEKLVVH